MLKIKQFNFSIEKTQSVISMLEHMETITVGPNNTVNNYLQLIDELRMEIILLSIKEEGSKKNINLLFDKLESIRKTVFLDLINIEKNNTVNRIELNKAAALWAKMICQIWSDE